MKREAIAQCIKARRQHINMEQARLIELQYNVDILLQQEQHQQPSANCHTPVLKSTEPKPPYVCPGCLITRIATI
jgi:hypothetical protein